jgi:uncharacterized protein YqeY
MQERLRADLLAAMKAKDETRLKVLRGAMAAIANAEAVDPQTAPKGATEVPRRELTDDDVRAVIRSEQAELDAAAADLRANARPDEAAALEQRRSILDAYL